MKKLNLDSRQKLLSSILVAVLITGLLTYQVSTQGILTQWNLPIYYLMRELRSPSLEPIFVQITLFNSLAMSCFWAVISVYFVLRKDGWRAIHWILLGIMVGGITIGLKYSTCVARPSLIFPVKDAFPSAHVSGNTTLLGGLVLLLDLNCLSLWKRWLIYTSYGTWVYLIILSRLYLEAHWLTDIIGGLLISYISLGLFGLLYYRKSIKPPFRLELTLVSLTCLLVCWLVRFIFEYEKIFKFYVTST